MRLHVRLKRFHLLGLVLLSILMLCGCPEPRDNVEAENGDSSENGGVLGLADPRSFASSISGTVYVDGRPMAYATVQVLDTEGNLVNETRSDESGYYIIKDLTSGRYDIIVLSSQGVRMGEPTMVQIRPGRMEQVDLEIEVSN